MSIEVDLGDGKYAVIKEIDELRSGDTKKVNESFSLRTDPESGEVIIPGDMDDSMWRALARNIVTDWNLEAAIPSKRPDSLDKLTLSQEDKLREALQPHLRAIKRVKEDKANGRDEPDPTDSPS